MHRPFSMGSNEIVIAILFYPVAKHIAHYAFPQSRGHLKGIFDVANSPLEAFLCVQAEERGLTAANGLIVSKRRDKLPHEDAGAYTQICRRACT